MQNPWNEIPLGIYEAHMAHSNVGQLQALNTITAAQLALGGRRVALLGAAGGNGLEHVSPTVDKVYALDINEEFLRQCRERHKALGSRLETVHCDLCAPGACLPDTDLLIANLLVEYIGVERFAELLIQKSPRIPLVSVVIQRNHGDGFVSSSGLAHRLDCLAVVHRDIDEPELIQALHAVGYRIANRQVWPLPNGKELIRLDFARSPDS